MGRASLQTAVGPAGSGTVGESSHPTARGGQRDPTWCTAAWRKEWSSTRPFAVPTAGTAATRNATHEHAKQSIEDHHGLQKANSAARICAHDDPEWFFGPRRAAEATSEEQELLHSHKSQQHN